MNNKSQKVLDRLAGREDTDRKRRMIWYGRWEDFADFLDTNPSKRQVLLRAEKLIDHIKGYGYAHISYSSREALDLVCQERGYK